MITNSKTKNIETILLSMLLLSLAYNWEKKDKVVPKQKTLP